MITRRTLIKSTSALALEMGSGCTHFGQISPSETGQSKRRELVIIVGAGIAGLSAAHRLSKAGHTVVVLEARDRIGGRIWTQEKFLGGPIDLGASWIHGGSDNPLHHLAEAHDIKTVKTDEQTYPLIFTQAGVGLGVERQKKLYRQFNLQLKAELYKRQYNLKLSEPDQSLGDLMNAVLKDLRAKSEIQSTEEFELRHLIATEISGAYATDVHNLSLRHWDKGHWFKGADLLLPGGYKQLLDILAIGVDIRTN
jgi:phytoene dehydrogenase-like protein